MEVAALPARLQQRIDCGLADALDRPQAVDDGLRVATGKAVIGLVHVRRQDFQPYVAAFLDQPDDLVGVVHVRGQHRRHERGRIMRLEPRRLVGHQGIRRRVRLVEAVARELLHQVEDVGRDPFVDPAPERALEEDLALLGHLLGLFLAHRAPQQVRAAQGVVAQHLGNLHHLLLVQDDAVGRLQDRFQIRMRVLDLGPTVLAVDEVVHHARLQRPRPVERHQRDDLLEAVGLQTLDQILHPAGFQLEHRGGLVILQQAEGVRIIQRDRVQVHALLGIHLADVLDRPVDDGERTQAEEIELDQADRLDIVLVEVRHQRSAVVFAVQWREIGQRGGCDHHPARMLAGVAGQALELLREIDDRADLLVLVIQRLQVLALGQGLLQGHAQFERDQLGDPVDEAVAMAQHTPDIAHHGLRGHGPVGDDLRHLVATVAFGDVVDHVVALLHAEIDIEVGHGDALWIQKPLEEKLVTQWIQVGNTQRIRHQRAGTRATARAHGDAVVLGPLNKVRHDQEVPGEPHLADHVQFPLQPRLVVLLRREAEALQTGGQTLRRGLAQVILHRVPLGHREVRQDRFAQGQTDRTAPRDRDAVGQGLGNIREPLRHLLRRTQVLRLRIAPRSPRIIEGHAVVNADPGLVGLEIFRTQEADIVGRHHRQVEGLGRGQRLLDPGLLARPVRTYQFQIEAPREAPHPGFQILGQQGAGGPRTVHEQPVDAPRQRDQALGGRVQPGAVHPRDPLLLAFLPGPRDQPRQVAVAGIVLRQQRHPCQAAVGARIAYQHVGPDDRLHALCDRGAVELHQPEQVAMIGNRDGRHAAIDDGLHQRLQPHQAVDEGILRMHPQVHEAGMGFAHAPASCSRAAMARATGPKLRRCWGHGPRRSRASRWATVGYPECRSKPYSG